MGILGLSLSQHTLHQEHTHVTISSLGCEYDGRTDSQHGLWAKDNIPNYYKIPGYDQRQSLLSVPLYHRLLADGISDLNG